MSWKPKRPIRFGLMSFRPAWQEAMEDAGRARRHGFDSLLTGDHLRHPRDPRFGFLDGWSMLAAWAAATSDIRLGMLVSNIIYRHPVVLARQAAAVDHISGGRLNLGIGTGVYATDHAMVGTEPWEPKKGSLGCANGRANPHPRGPLCRDRARPCVDCPLAPSLSTLGPMVLAPRIGRPGGTLFGTRLL